jgi:type IV pilus assembly protein PilY1
LRDNPELTLVHGPSHAAPSESGIVMNITTHLHSKSGFVGKLLSASLSVWMLGAIYTPALAAVTVDPQPLTVQASLPPNVVLMLDDSGSMASDFMPDKGSMPSDGASATVNPDSYQNAANNGTYFNPTVTYSAPPKAAPKADGTVDYYATPTGGVGAAYKDGFLDTSAVDVTQYSKGSYNYYTKFTITTTSTYAPTSTPTYSCPSGYSGPTNSGTTANPVWQCTKGQGKNKVTISATGPVDVLSCNSGDTLDASNQCVTTTSSYKYFFTYVTGPAVGPYTASAYTNGTVVKHYVGKTGDCAALPVIAPATCDDSAATQQNVANWFSYYRTRMLMAKSGLMSAFSTIDPTFRIGFGSIDGGNANSTTLGSDWYQFTTSAGGNSYQTGIAVVKPFGTGVATTQKARFWDWLVNEAPTGNTPLRMALDFVGQYYKTTQPWQSPDPNDSTKTVELACRQSYTILTTDGFWNDSFSGIGNADNPTVKPTVTGPNGQSYTYTPAAPYSDSSSNTLADVAMKYWITDLRPLLLNEVPPSAEDPAFWQHMSTFTLGLGFTPTGIAPAGTTIDQIFKWANGAAAIAGFSWPTPSSDSINNIADLAHAAVNGHGGFYSATSPDSFASGLKSALQRAAERTGTGASLAANSTQLSSGSFAYQATYHTARWNGDLQAFAIDPTTGKLSTTPTWVASAHLPAFGARNIHTYDSAAAVGSQDVLFTSSATPASLKSALGTAAADQQTMIDYLRGDASLEGTTYRKRVSPLGDIVDSQPVYVGAPDPNQFNNQVFTGSSSFATYAAGTAKTRTSLIYVAANDGMLHAFNASTGAEAYAYLPAAVVTDPVNGLKKLADPDYGTALSKPHQYFNDGELTVADTYYASAWHTVAVGTTGRGTARTVYALDVTDPASIALLWERSALDGKTNSNYIGQMAGKPVIAQIADGSWSVLMGNGYNSTANTAALLQFNLADGSLTVHATSTDTDNGLAAPVVWLGDPSNGISTVAYAGDRLGQVWSFGLNTGTTTATSTPSSAGIKLFTAVDSAGKAQPITAGMLAGKDPATSNVWLFFGTGQYLNSGDVSTKDVQSWYGLIVQSPTSGLATDGTKTRTDLEQRSIVAETAGAAAVVADPTATPPVAAKPAVSPARAVTAASALPSGKSGWYMDLESPSSSTDATTGLVTYTPNAVAKGERMVNPNLFQGNLLIGTTRIPTATDACNPSGSGWIMAIDPFTGTSPSASFFDINNNGTVDSSDSVSSGSTTLVNSGVGFTSIPNNPIFVGSNMLVSYDNGTTGNYSTQGSNGNGQRVSWRELINP